RPDQVTARPLQGGGVGGSLRLTVCVVGVDDGPLLAIRLDEVLAEREDTLPARRGEAEAVTVALSGGKGLRQAAGRGKVSDLQPGNEVLDAEALGAEDAANQHVRVLLLNELLRHAHGLGRVPLGVYVDGLQLVPLDAARSVDLVDREVRVDTHLCTLDRRGSTAVVDHADSDRRSS